MDSIISFSLAATSTVTTDISLINSTTTASIGSGAASTIAIAHELYTTSIGKSVEIDENGTIATTPASATNTAMSWLSTGRIQIPLYATILLLAIIGNSLVILTLIQNRRMRTITNVFLLNLAISDILLGVLCMPFTLIGTLLRDFVFGEVMCKLLPYLQASSVAVSAWTLVAISLERYYAICDPLRSRRWQTLKHAYKLIALIWCASFAFMSPIAVLSRLIPTSQGHHKCREQWPDNTEDYERAFNLFLDMILLIFPLVLLSTAYFSITRTLWRGMNMERSTRRHIVNYNAKHSVRKPVGMYCNSNGSSRNRCTFSCKNRKSCEHVVWYQIQDSNYKPSTTESHIISSKKLSVGLRRTNTEKSLQNKKRVIQMLFVVVLEFFICWTPLYIINTVTLFDQKLVYKTIGYSSISYFQLLAYSSSCCNPITYCFMNRGFRKACLNLFRCCKRIHETRRISIGGGPIGITQSSDVT